MPPSSSPADRVYSNLKDSVFAVLVIGWAAVFVSHIVGPLLRDRLIIRPAVNRATDLEGRGGDLIALPMLLEHVHDDPKNPRLLWALGDIYTKMDRPLLAHFYFRALRNVDTSGLDPEWLDFAQPWQHGQDTEDRTEIMHELTETQESFAKLKGGIARVYPDSINAVLNQPASTVSVPFGYFPPQTPICGTVEGRDRQCGYAFEFQSGNFWQAISTQQLRVVNYWGGSDCCSVSLDDPDLRSPSLVTEDYRLQLENEGKQSGLSAEERQRDLLAFRVRVLTKQLFVLGFLDGASAADPEIHWTFWRGLLEWVKAICWGVGLIFVLILLNKRAERFKARSTAPLAARARGFLRRHSIGASLIVGLVTVFPLLVHLGFYSHWDFKSGKALGLFVAQFIPLGMSIKGVYNSQRRWVSIAYAVLGLAAFVMVYMISLFILTSIHPLSVAATNKVLDGMEWVILIPAALGAGIPARRK